MFPVSLVEFAQAFVRPLAIAGLLVLVPVSAYAEAGLVKTTTVTYTYDDYDNVIETNSTVTDGVETFSSSVVSTIENDEAKWLLGRVSEVTTTNTNADLTSLSRTSATTYHGDTFAPATTTAEPGDPTLEVVTSYDYDSFGNVTSTSVSAAGEVTRTATTSYTADGRFTLSSTNALSHSASVVTDTRFGVPTSTTDANGVLSTFKYDDFGRPLREIHANGTETVNSYDLCSDAEITCPTGAVERVMQRSLETASSTLISADTYVYIDRHGREIRSESQMADGSVIYSDTVYDSFGRVIKVSDPYKVGSSSIDWTETEYDVLDRAIRVTETNGAITTTAYDGLSVSITTPLLETESRKSNVRGELVLVTDTMGGTISYSYDPFGNLIKTRDAQNNEVIIAYDNLGKKISMDDPDMGYWSYGYNSYGELTSQTDAKGQTNNLSYDVLGRLIQRVEAEGTTSWAYDTATNGVGLLHTATGPGGAGEPAYLETHSYDSLSRPSSTTQNIKSKDFTTLISYDTAGRLGQVSYPTGFAVDYSYTTTGYLDEITKSSDLSLIWKAKARDAEGRVREAQLGNGLTEWTDVDELGRVTSRRLSGGLGLQLDLAMTFDLVGNLTARQDNIQDREETFGYDALNRLTSNLLVKTSDSSQLATTSYGYDIIGNLTYKSDLSNGGIMTYDPARPHAVATAKGSSYFYDLNGNLTAGGGRAVSWTSFNKPATIDATASLSMTSFVYGPDRARIRQTIVEAGTITEVAYAGSYYEERTPVTSAGVQSGTMEQIHYIRADEASLAIHKIEVAVDLTTTEKTRWMSLDHIGSTTVITDELGLAEERLSYDPHGKRREADWLEASLPVRPSFTPRGFTGHEHLDAVGIIHMNGRVYDPELGRFLSADPNIPDPLYTQDFNRYSYVRNNPLSYTDPSGFYTQGPPDDGTRGGQEPDRDLDGSDSDRNDGSPSKSKGVIDQFLEDLGKLFSGAPTRSYSNSERWEYDSVGDYIRATTNPFFGHANNPFGSTASSYQEYIDKNLSQFSNTINSINSKIGSYGTLSLAVSKDLMVSVAYNGVYHDIVKNTLVDLFKKSGVLVEAEVTLVSVKSKTKARADLIVLDPVTGMLTFIDVKTGIRPRYTPNQKYIYGLALLGNHLYSPSKKIQTFGYKRHEVLPKMSGFIFRKINKNTKEKITRITKEMLDKPI